MSLRAEKILRDQRRTAFVAALLAAGFAVLAPVSALAATTWTVTNCTDSTGAGLPGSLRSAITSAASNDTIDMTGLTCGTLEMVGSAITISQNSLTLNGPGMGKLTIGCSAAQGCNGLPDRLLNHTNTGTLFINDLSLAYGNLYSAPSSARGGCIYSAGTVAIKHVGVSHCQARSSTVAEGGAIYAKDGLSMQYSTLSYNLADGQTARGGAVRTNGTFSAKYSTISKNKASGSSSAVVGGGLYLGGNVSITSSTISGNSATKFGGIGIYSANPASRTTTITNSTISGNTGSEFSGGLYVNSGTVNIRNSTITLNTDGNGTNYAAGMATSARLGPMAVTLQSSLIANNTSGTTESDLSKTRTSANTITFSGNNNLIGSTAAAVPPDTIKNSCPLLGPLRDNGGLTQTHALLSHSPAIDTGNNAANQHEDQRRDSLSDSLPYPYPRVSGMTADIGAYEVQQDDIVFNTGFDGCPLLM